MLQLPSFHPLGCFQEGNGLLYTMRGHHVQDCPQKACILAYPDASHYMRVYISRLMSHSFRVGAAVALYNASVSPDDISFRLR
jgi:hypothetical protein